MKNWTTFWFDTNCASGLVDSQESWKEMRSIWNNGAHGMKPEDIYDKNLSFDRVEPQPDDIPSFGSRSEHIGGKITLGEFFDACGMDR